MLHRRLTLSGLRLLAIAPFVAAGLAQPLAAERGPAWHFNAFKGGVALRYGVPKTDDVRFLVLCDNQKPRVDVTVFEHIKNVTVGHPVTIELAAGAEKVLLKGRATEEEPNVIFGRAENVDVKSVIAVLRAPAELTATMGETRMKYPQRGRAAAADGFVKRCKAG